MKFASFPFEIKSINDGGRIEGVISTFGNVDSYGDTIEPGAYTKSLTALARSGRKLPMLYQHNMRQPIGVWADLTQTDKGLVGVGDLVMDVPDAKAAHSLAKAGALTGISIGYDVPKGGWRKEGKTRILQEINLWEASLVTFPADTHARITTVKSIGGPADIEDIFRDAGMSGRKAKSAASAAWRAINEQSDEAAADAELAALITASTARLRKGAR